LMFAAALKLGRPKKESKAFQLPQGTRRLACIVGLFGASLTVLVGFIPPDGIQIKNPLEYITWIALGNIVLVLPAPLLWIYRRNNPS
jgi:hypothetical protein